MIRDTLRLFGTRLHSAPALSALLFACAVASAPPAQAQTSSAPAPPTSGTATAAAQVTHVVTVTFDYDFSKTPPCGAKITRHCVQQFIAYDISAGADHPTMLFPIPLPAHPAGAVKGITRAGPPLEFEPGKHQISVSAMAPDGTHSRRSLCTTWITIPPSP